jgi:phosphoglycerol transferase MdoB-like AlkP superfamily enzyme
MRETAGQRHREARYFEQHWGWSALGRGKRFSSLTEIREATISAIESPEPITPFFLLIRSLYTHSPYRGIFDDPDYVIKLSRRGWVSRLVGGFQRGLERWENEFLNPVLRVLDDRGQIDNTIIMIMSDHGEMLWDLEEDLRDSSESDELWRHQLEPYNALIRVPLLIWGTGLRGTYPGVFRLVDVAPTLLDILGLEPDHDAYDGVSLFRPAERPIYADSAGYGYGGVALYTADGKYLISERLGNSLYKIDLTEYESLNRRERALDGDPVRAFVTRHGRFPDLIKEDENDSALVNRLRALGYVQ